MLHDDHPTRSVYIPNGSDPSAHLNPLPLQVLQTAARSSLKAGSVSVLKTGGSPQKRLLKLSVVLCASAILACMGVIAYSSTYPATDGISQLGLMRCGELPCFRGIEPGRTSWADAVAAFNGQSSIRIDGFAGNFVLFPSKNGASLGAIFIRLPLDQLITIGELIAFYGTPSCVHIFRQSHTLILHYPSLHVLTQFVDHRISASTSIKFILIGEPVTLLDQHQTQCDPTRFDSNQGQVSRRAWRGFASARSYFEAGQ
jgi:hypothetical protein